MAKRKLNPPVELNGVKVGSLYQREGTANWWFKWTPPSGFVQKMTTGHDHFDEAMEWAQNHADSHATEECATQGAAVSAGRAKTLAAVLKLYVQDRIDTKRWNKDTVRRTEPVLERLVSLLGKERSPGIINREKIKGWMDWERKRKKIDPKTGLETQKLANKPSTLISTFSNVKHFVKWIKREGYLGELPDFSEIAPKKADVRSTVGKRSWSATEVAKIARHLADKGRTFWLDYFKVAVGVGLRPSELAHLRACDFNAEAKILSVQEYSEWTTKTVGSVRTVPLVVPKTSLHPEVYEVLVRRQKEALEAAGPEALLFPKFGRGLNRQRVEAPWGEGSLRVSFQRAIEGSGVHGFPYMARHTFARRTAAAKWSKEYVAKLMGHSEESTTHGYSKEMTALEFNPSEVLPSVFSAAALVAVA